MIFFVANDGTVISSVPSPVYQGAANTNNIYLIAPFAENLQASVSFKLPNGVYTTRYPMTQVQKLSGIVNEQTGQTYNGWQFSMPNEITQYFGTVTAQFFFYSAQGGVVTATSSTSFVVEKGVPSILPPSPSESVYDAIMSQLSALSQQLNNGAYAARAIYQWNSTYTYGAGEITYYANYGTYGAFVKSLKTDNTTEPFTNGVLNSDNWLLVSDFNILNDLYGLKEEVQEAVTQSQANASAAAGSANAAQQSASSAESAAQTATTAAERLDGAANYIESVQNGTTAVPNAVSDSAGNNIANQFTTVNSDIAGLREDITNESHFRGLFDSVDALKAAYPTATPNDYAYIAGGNQWIYQDGEWTDSEVPTPSTNVPASDSTPLMDGTASAGTSSEYSRGDHRHPTDTTLLSKYGGTMTGTLTLSNGQSARGYFSPSSSRNILSSDQSGFYSGVFDQYSKYLVCGEGGDKAMIGWQFITNQGLWIRKMQNGNININRRLTNAAAVLLDENGNIMWSNAHPATGCLVTFFNSSNNSNYFFFVTDPTRTPAQLEAAIRSAYNSSSAQTFTFKAWGFWLWQNRIYPQNTLQITYDLDVGGPTINNEEGYGITSIVQLN